MFGLFSKKNKGLLTNVYRSAVVSERGIFIREGVVSFGFNFVLEGKEQSNTVDFFLNENKEWEIKRAVSHGKSHAEYLSFHLDSIAKEVLSSVVDGEKKTVKDILNTYLSFQIQRDSYLPEASQVLNIV